MKPVEVMPSSLSLDVFPLDRSVYQALIEEYVNHFSRHDGVVWIGQYGSIGTPGVSDIDLLVVCEEEHYRVVKRHSQEFVRQSPVHHYAFWHDVAVVPETAVKYLLYFHTLGNLHTLWGSSGILESLEQPDEIIALFRNILFNSLRWGALLRLCQRDSVSLRLTLILSKTAITSAVHDYRRTGNEDYAGIIALRDQQERQRILAAHPSAQSDLARAYLWEAIQTLSKADWDLSNWLIREGILSRSARQRRIHLSPDHVVVLDDSFMSSQGVLHQHIDDKHVTYLPSFYYTIGQIILQPYLQLQPDLSKVWSTTASEHIENPRIGAAARKWNEALTSTFDDLRRVGGDPLELNGFPFDLRVQRFTISPMVRGFAKRVLPAGVRRWLGAQLQHLIQ